MNNETIRRPNSATPPLCGWEWYLAHKHAYTQRDIDDLTLVVRCGSFKLPAIRAGTNRKAVREILRA